MIYQQFLCKVSNDYGSNNKLENVYLKQEVLVYLWKGWSYRITYFKRCGKLWFFVKGMSAIANLHSRYLIGEAFLSYMKKNSFKLNA